MNRTGRRVVVSGACLAMISFVSSTWADYACSGLTDSAEVNPQGIVVLYASSIFGSRTPAAVCQLGTSNNGVSAEACKAILATLLAAQVSRQGVVLNFNDSPTCGSNHISAGGWLTQCPGGPRIYSP